MSLTFIDLIGACLSEHQGMRRVIRASECQGVHLDGAAHEERGEDDQLQRHRVCVLVDKEKPQKRTNERTNERKSRGSPQIAALTVSPRPVISADVTIRRQRLRCLPR